jgi:predicted DCC family thiol-disulfide oxidoreductase YuxK
MNTLSSATLPITVFYDASCPLCHAEMSALKLRDQYDEICLVDCSSSQFDDSEFLKQGISRELMMKRIHGMDAIGRWYVGVDLFAIVYRIAQMKWLSRLWGSQLLRPALVRLYPWVADNRMVLSKFNIPRIFQTSLFNSTLKTKMPECESGTCKPSRKI